MTSNQEAVALYTCHSSNPHGMAPMAHDGSGSHPMNGFCSRARCLPAESLVFVKSKSVGHSRQIVGCCAAYALTDRKALEFGGHKGGICNENTETFPQRVLSPSPFGHYARV